MPRDSCLEEQESFLEVEITLSKGLDLGMRTGGGPAGGWKFLQPEEREGLEHDGQVPF